MIEQVPLVGSLTTGFGSGPVSAPTARTPNLEEASQDFVSMLYSYMFQQMRESGSDEEDGLFSGPHVNMLMGFLDQEVGKKLAQGAGAGLAATLRQQLGGDQAAAETSAEGADAPEAVEILSKAGNTIKELTQKSPEAIDNSKQIMDELYKINRRE